MSECGGQSNTPAPPILRCTQSQGSASYQTVFRSAHQKCALIFIISPRIPFGQVIEMHSRSATCCGVGVSEVAREGTVAGRGGKGGLVVQGVTSFAIHFLNAVCLEWSENLGS